MGNWKGRYDGTALGQATAGTCSLAIDWSGNIMGSCAGGAVVFNLVGQVGADGTLTLLAASSGNTGLAVTAKLDNLQQISGSWSALGYGGGTLTITQD